MNWYPFFFVTVAVLCGISSTKDRNALRVVLAATIASFLITEWVTRPIHASWKLAIPATVETLTILALLHWAKNRTGYLQAGLLSIAWATHVLCYYDLNANTNLVYDNYGRILAAVAVGQIAACYDTPLHYFKSWLASVRASRGRSVPVASGLVGVSNPTRR